MKRLFLSLICCTMCLIVFSCGQQKKIDTMKENEDVGIAYVEEEFTIVKVKDAQGSDLSQFKYEDVEGGIAITEYTGSDEIVAIPEQIDGKNVMLIADNAFANNENIKGVNCSTRLMGIGKSAFANCSQLEIVICGPNLLYIGERAFENCGALWHLELNEGLSSLEFGCLENTTALKELYIPNSVRYVYNIFLTLPVDTTIVTKDGSAAAQYAKDNNINLDLK